MPEFIPMEVVCPGCGQSYHNTTPLFDPKKFPHGAMFVLKPSFGPDGFNWSSFAQDEDVMDAELFCPGCGINYLSEGRIIVRSIHDDVRIEVDGRFTPAEVEAMMLEAANPIASEVASAPQDAPPTPSDANVQAQAPEAPVASQAPAAPSTGVAMPRIPTV